MRGYLAIVTLFLFFGCMACTASKEVNSDSSAIGRVLTAGLADPWEISWVLTTFCGSQKRPAREWSG